MKLIVTVGNDIGDSEELVFDVPEPITYLGAEVVDHENANTGRATILRVPFHSHGQRIHTVCALGNESPLDEIRRLHEKQTDALGDYCGHCRELCHSHEGLSCDDPYDGAWPCATMRIIEQYQ